MSLTTDPGDPRLGHGVDGQPIDQHEVYLVLSAEEIAKGYTRPLRRSYIHAGPAGPEHPLRDLTEDEKAVYADYKYVKYEAYKEDGSAVVGRFWTQAQLDGAGKGCGVETKMGLALCETYARDPKFYGATYCAHCRMHKRVDEFRWTEDGKVVGS